MAAPFWVEKTGCDSRRNDGRQLQEVEGAAPSAPINPLAVTANRPPTELSRDATKQTDNLT
jgi:hypothetical protein